MIEMQRRPRHKIRRKAARFGLPLVGIVGVGLAWFTAVVAGWLS